MSLSKVKTFAIALALTAAAANAQFNTPTNARTLTLAGAPLADITDIHSYPVLITGYLNQAQATWNAEGGGTGLGTVFLTKSFGDVVGLGIIANNGSILTGAWNGTPINQYIDALPNVPHVLLGFNFGAFKLGADLFFELASSNNNQTTTGNQEAGKTDSTETTTNYNRVMNLGARVSAGIDVGDLGILAKVGFGLPSFKSERTREGFHNEKLAPVTANGDSIGYYDQQNYSTKSEKGLYLEFGAEISAPVSVVDLTGGFEYTFADFKLGQRTYENDDLNLDLEWSMVGSEPLGNVDYYTDLLRFYLSAEVNILETAAAVVGYEFAREAQTEKTTYKQWMQENDPPRTDQTVKPSKEIVPERNNKTTDGTIYHSFYVGAENTWDNVWIFDSFSLRSGLAYTIEWTFQNVKDDYYDNASHEGNAADHKYGGLISEGYTKPVIGVGVSKGALALDVALNFARLFEPATGSGTPDGAYRGPLNAPTFAAATATIKF